MFFYLLDDIDQKQTSTRVTYRIVAVKEFTNVFLPKNNDDFFGFVICENQGNLSIIIKSNSVG